MRSHFSQPRARSSRRVLLLGALRIALPLLLVAGCTLCPLVGGRRQGDEPTPAASAVEGEATPTAVPTPDAATLDQALSEGDWETRMAAAHAVPGRDDIPLQNRVDMLSDALAREVDQPSGEPQPDHTYLSAAGMLRVRLTRSLGDLGGSAAKMLRQRASDAQGDARASYLVALGYMGEKDVAPELRDALQSSPDPVVRMDAARVLGILGDREAIPALQAALADPFVAEGRDSLGTYSLYPVREQAAGALHAMGVTVERDGDTFTARP